MDAYELTQSILSHWQKLAIGALSASSAKKDYPIIHACVIMDDTGKRNVIGCHVEGSVIVLDLENING